jgi:hypothetical protein
LIPLPITISFVYSYCCVQDRIPFLEEIRKIKI